MATLPIKLIVGLGNPGSKYDKTRHNAGAWFIEYLAAQHSIQLRADTSFQGLYSRLHSDSLICHLLIPTTFMNHSGRAVRALAHYYKLQPEEILVVHDELDLMPGVARLKEGGGSGGHNGLKDIVHILKTPKFWRLRLGIGHPGRKEQVIHYVLNAPNQADFNKIEEAIFRGKEILPLLLEGQLQKAMQQLHTS
jgi:PTH1 family peptidyl-tRNA hydrolase